MKNKLSTVGLFATLLIVAAQAVAGEPPDRHRLWLHYQTPAKDWEPNGLPIGNGQMGAMLLGNEHAARIQFNEESLWLGNEDDTGKYQNFGDITVRFDDEESITCPSGHIGWGSQVLANTVDGDLATKWCFEHHNRFPIVWQKYVPAGEQSRPLTSYTIASADIGVRDPSAWRFLGSQDGKQWKLLDERRDVPPWPRRHAPQTFTFANKAIYAYYRFEFLAVHQGAPHFEVSEIALGSLPKKSARPAGYGRALDIGQAVYHANWVRRGVQITQEAFASHPAKVIALRWTADRPAALSATVQLSDAHGARTVIAGDTMTISGEFPGYQYDGGKRWLPLHREAQLRVLTSGGAVTAQGDALVIDKADSLTLLLAAGTDFKQDRRANWRGELPHAAVAARLDAAARNSFDQLREEHVRDYRQLFDRVSLSLGGHAEPETPTDVRLRQYRPDEPDLGLEELLFQYGRYLLISSSRADGLPANLQGKWNQSNNPPWRCDYHTDVNVEMNYWMADVANLGECFEPYARWIDSIRAVRCDATRRAFGTRGWTIRGESGLFGGSTWEWVPGASAWLLQNSYDHYLFTGDKEYLRRFAYPAMKEVCQFWLDRLKRKADGTLVTPPGLSPEHGPVEEGVSFDMQLAWDVFNSTAEAAEILGVDAPFRRQIVAARDALAKPRIGRWGQLQEWRVDRDDPHDHHRHTSHLIAVFPGRQISVTKTPELAKAAAVSLEGRGMTGDSRREWAFVWRMALWARLREGDKAHRMAEALFQYGLLPNLFCSHPPFQMDGNFGYVAGVCEMLLQSHAEEVHLLPALPKAWPSGKVTGLRARGGFTVDLSWRDGRVTSYRISAATPRPVKVRIGETVKEVMADGTMRTP
jgi:alpha-L-fucosidase 2